MNKATQDVVVSVVLTTYNGKKFLVEQLDSIINQTYTNMEIIICDDASTDSTPEIIRRYAAKDSRIVTVCHTRNIGLHKNIESGLMIAKGDYIAISDQDDIWNTDKIEKLLSCIANHIAVFSDSRLINERGLSLDKTIMQAIHVKDYASSTQPLNLVQKNVVSGHALLFHKSLLQKVLPFSERLIFDHQLALIASVNGGLGFFPEPLVHHRIHSTNHTNFRLIHTHQTLQTKVKRSSLRRRQQRDYLLHNLELLWSTIATDKIVDRAFIQSLERVIHAMRANQHRFFDFQLLLALVCFDRRYHYFGLRRCIKLCKGHYWYEIAKQFGVR